MWVNLTDERKQHFNSIRTRDLEQYAATISHPVRIRELLAYADSNMYYGGDRNRSERSDTVFMGISTNPAAEANVLAEILCQAEFLVTTPKDIKLVNNLMTHPNMNNNQIHQALKHMCRSRHWKTIRYCTESFTLPPNTVMLIYKTALNCNVWFDAVRMAVLSNPGCPARVKAAEFGHIDFGGV